MSNNVGHAGQLILYTVGSIYICPIYIHVYTVIQFFLRCVVDDHMSLVNLRPIHLLLVHTYIATRYLQCRQ